jgi:hypothetical protein
MGALFSRCVDDHVPVERRFRRKIDALLVTLESEAAALWLSFSQSLVVSSHFTGKTTLKNNTKLDNKAPQVPKTRHRRKFRTRCMPLPAYLPVSGENAQKVIYTCSSWQVKVIRWMMMII